MKIKTTESIVKCREISFAHNLFLSCLIVLEFYVGHGCYMKTKKKK